MAHPADAPFDYDTLTPLHDQRGIGFSHELPLERELFM